MSTPDLCSLPWRCGRHLGRTVYAMAGAEASDADVLVGIMDTPELAAEAVTAHNCGIAGGDVTRRILEALCERDGISLESSVTPGEPARSYELALRLRIGQVSGLRND